MNTKNKNLIEKAESLGWSVTEEGENQYLFSKHSPVGQDFNVSIVGSNAEEVIDNIKVAYDDFDVSEETYLWLDNTGHGKNGAPYEMRNVLEDMEACEQMILDLYNVLDLYNELNKNVSSVESGGFV